MSVFKVTLEFEFDEEQLKDLFEEQDIKFSKKKLGEFKKDIKNTDAFYDFSESLKPDVEDLLKDYLTEMFE